MRNWPTLRYKEEGMREGMQIEDANIAIPKSLKLLRDSFYFNLT